MNKLLIPFVLTSLFTLLCMPNLFAQPLNDECVNAFNISNAFEGNCGDISFNGAFTLRDATPGVDDPPEPGEAEVYATGKGPYCLDETDGNLFGDASEIWEQSVWFTFTVPDLYGDGSPVAYSIWTSDGTYGDDCGLDPTLILGNIDTQVAIYEGTCPSAITDPCDHFAASEDLSSVPPWNSGWLSLAFTPGVPYYMAIDGWDATEGQFCITVVVCGVEEGDSQCAPVEGYCDSIDCRDECPFGNIAAIEYDDSTDGFTFSNDLSGNIFFCSYFVNGYVSPNTYLAFGSPSFTDCNGENNGVNITLSNGSVVNIDPSEDGSYHISTASLNYIELTEADIATGALTVTSQVPDGLGNICGETIVFNYSDFPQATDPYCNLTCLAGGIEESLLTYGIEVCEDGDFSICTNGLEDLTLPCLGGNYGYYWRAYIKVYGNWENVTGWVNSGPCPTLPVADFFIDKDGIIPPNFVPGAQIEAASYGTGEPLELLIEGAALCLDADGNIIDGCLATNGPDFFTNVNGTNRTMIPVTYYSTGNLACGYGSPTQVINLNSGWNLISLDVEPIERSIHSVFSTLQPGNLEIVTSFDNGTISYIVDAPVDISTLREIEDGFGYWVKIKNADVLVVDGRPLNSNFRKPLDAGWNLIAYPLDITDSPAMYFANLISNGNLEFVQGFHEEIVFFDPNLPPFLNTLQQLENGHGYWVKVTNAFR